MFHSERPWASGATWTALRRMGWGPILAVLMVVAGCAQQTPTPPPFVADTAQRTLAAGFQQLSERYLEYLPVGVLAFEGLRGLNALDPAFEARREGNRVVYQVEGWPAHEVALPADTDAEGWANRVIEAVRQVKQESRAIAVASQERIFEAVFDGSLSLLDSYSRYASAAEAIRNRERRSGFGGLGLVVHPSFKGVTVSEIYFDSPAKRAGMKEGDLITHFDGQPLAGSMNIDPSTFGRGTIGTPVMLRVERKGFLPFEIELRRQRVVEPTVFVSARNNIVTARITGFNRRTTRHLATQLTEAIQQLDGAAKGIVLDLRGNPGGLLSEAIKVADLFILEGRILSTHGRHPASVHNYDAREDDVGDGLPMVVIVNGRSASASEIVAAALQDHERAVVVGSSSYGKGTVQTVIPLPNEGELTVTWSRFVTPSGYTLNGLGVHPSICTASPKSTAEQLIHRAVSSGKDIVEMFREWREADRTGADRKRLKAQCPASDVAADVDGAIAEALITDSDLYSRVISLAPAMASAESRRAP
jgi:carboxyl-terminal processing protease